MIQGFNRTRDTDTNSNSCWVIEENNDTYYICLWLIGILHPERFLLDSALSCCLCSYTVGSQTVLRKSAKFLVFHTLKQSSVPQSYTGYLWLWCMQAWSLWFCHTGTVAHFIKKNLEWVSVHLTSAHICRNACLVIFNDIMVWTILKPQMAFSEKNVVTILYCNLLQGKEIIN